MPKWMLPGLAGLCVYPVSAQDPSPPFAKKEIAASKEINLCRTSVGALAVAKLLDVQSSWGKRELNPNLANSQGTFGRDGALLKASIQGGVIALDDWVWLPSGAFEPADLPAMEMFVRLPEEIGWETFDLQTCIPVARL